jgi:hypothetical protein
MNRPVVATLIFIALTLFATVVGAATFVEDLDALKEPSLGADARSVTDARWTWGNTTFRFSGEVESVLAGGQTVGFALSGTGAIDVTVAEGPFHQANLSTLKTHGHKSGDTVSRTFEQAVVFTDSTPDALASGERTTSSRLADILSRSLERWRDTRFPQMDAVLAGSVYNASHGTTAMAMLWCDDGRDLVYTVDTEIDRDENLYQWEKFTRASMNFYRLEPLVQQVVNASVMRNRPIPELRQTDIHIEVTSPDNEMVYQTTTTTLTAARQGIRLATLNLTNGKTERYAEWFEREDPFTVTSVTTTDGTAVEFAHRYDDLMVLLPTTLNTGDSIELIIKAEGRLLKNYQGDSFLVLGNMDWFPSLSIFEVHAPVRVTVKVKEPFHAIAVGEDVRRWTEEGGIVALESYEDSRVSFPFVVVGDFVTLEEEKGPYRIKIHSYATAKKRGAKALARNGLAILDYYSNGMEDFPYGELEVVEIPYFRHFFWQAPSGLVEITSEGLAPIAGDTSDVDTIMRRYASKGQNARYAHEIAHQWFGNVVSWGSQHDNWISESFAEYLSYMFMSEGGGEKKKAMVQLKEWKIDVDECSDRGSVYGASSLAGSSTNRGCYTQLLYGKGPYVLHALRQDMGDENFKKMLYFLTVQANKKNLKVITEDIIQFASAVGGKDYRPWFEKYIFGTEIPPVEM